MIFRLFDVCRSCRRHTYARAPLASEPAPRPAPSNSGSRRAACPEKSTRRSRRLPSNSLSDVFVCDSTVTKKVFLLPPNGVPPPATHEPHKKQMGVEEQLHRLPFNPFLVLCKNIAPIAKSNRGGGYAYDLEYAEGGDLCSLLQVEGLPPITLDEARLLMAQLVLGLQYIHQNNFIHRDLKPENILITAAGDVKIADFGLAGMPDKTGRCDTRCGSVPYCAPEMFDDKKARTRAVDIWSLGVIFYSLLEFEHPFLEGDGDSQSSRQATRARIEKRTVRSPLSDALQTDAPARELFDQMCQPDYRRRPPVEALKKHAFFDGLDWSAIARGDVSSPLRRLLQERDSLEQQHGLSNEFLDF